MLNEKVIAVIDKLLSSEITYDEGIFEINHLMGNNMNIIEGSKNHRHEREILEKKFHDEFIDEYSDRLDSLVFGTTPSGNPKDDLTNREKQIVINTIQWLGSSVGEGFLNKIGFKLK